MTTTLKSIAAKLDISVSLVSRVLNDRMGTSGARPELIEAIRRTAKEMDYQKNLSAAAVRNGCHDAIGIFLHNYGRPGSGTVDALLRGIAAEARREKQRFTLDFIEEDEKFLAYSDIIKKTMIDGVLLGGIPHKNVKDMLRFIAKSNMPVVTVADNAISSRVPNIGVDQVEIGRMATEHLIQQGCRNIAHVVDFQERFEGYGMAMRKNNLPIRQSLIYREGEASFSHERGRRAARFLLKAKPAVDGVFAQSDEEAVVIMNVLMDNGIRVPEDVRIIGVDNAPYCDFTRVPLSSISQNGIELGRKAVAMLLSRIKGNQVESVVISPTLCIRESTR